MLERRVRTAKYLVFRTRENPWKQRETGGRKSLSRGGFRVVLVMTSSIALRISQLFSVRWENARKTRKNNMKLWNPNPRKALCGGHFQRTKRPELPKISSAAPSTTRTTLRVCNSAFLPKTFGKNWRKEQQNIQFSNRRKPCIYGLFKRSKQPTLQKISSQSRYDRFDTPAYIFLAPPRTAFGKMRDFDAR